MSNYVNVKISSKVIHSYDITKKDNPKVISPITVSEDEYNRKLTNSIACEIVKKKNPSLKEVIVYDIETIDEKYKISVDDVRKYGIQDKEEDK